MEDSYGSRTVWRFLDGSISISVSMLVAVALNQCAFCMGLPILGVLKDLTHSDDGVIIVATLLLFPTVAALYGGFRVFFAAKEAVEKKARERGREEGREEGRQEERDRIAALLSQHGVTLTPEMLHDLNRNGDSK